jgi:hypothetical protein
MIRGPEFVDVICIVELAWAFVSGFFRVQAITVIRVNARRLEETSAAAGMGLGYEAAWPIRITSDLPHKSVRKE